MKKMYILSLIAMSSFAVSGCVSTSSIAPLAIAAAGAAGGYLTGGAIDDSDGAKIAGMAVGLIAASQAYEYLDKSGEQKVLEAYEQGKREARVEASTAYWNAITGADGSEFRATNDSSKKLRQVDRDPHVTEGVIYGARYISAEDFQTVGE